VLTFRRGIAWNRLTYQRPTVPAVKRMGNALTWSSLPVLGPAEPILLELVDLKTVAPSLREGPSRPGFCVGGILKIFARYTLEPTAKPVDMSGSDGMAIAALRKMIVPNF
jgi:hypothetical protein